MNTNLSTLMKKKEIHYNLVDNNEGIYTSNNEDNLYNNLVRYYFFNILFYNVFVIFFL